MLSKALLVLQVYLLLFMIGCAHIPDANRPDHITGGDEDIYLYSGLKPVNDTDSVDGILQDFIKDGGTVGSSWADVDAAMHSGSDAWMKAKVIRKEKLPYLNIELARQGYGTNIMIIPKDSHPELIPPKSKLVFDLRSGSGLCMGIRVLDRDGEVWAHGPKHLEYFQQCPGKDNKWKTFEIDLNPDPKKWFHFRYSGNLEKGNKIQEMSLIARLYLEIGSKGKYNLRNGGGSIDIRNIRVVQ